MAISVTKFKNSCLDVIRRVETTGQAVAITRRGKVVARIAPSFESAKSSALKPWEQLRSLGGRLVATPGESVASDKEFEALR
jgi:prevent-host-death family protein